ncbi:MAG: TlpA disulfide reductase family protein [Tissierellales bacterium]
MKNKTVIIVVAVVLGILAVSIGAGFLITKNLKNVAIKEQEEIIQRASDNTDNKKIELDDIVDIGDSAPDFILKDLEGNSVSIKDFKGEKAVFLNFWASWCPPCREEMPDLDKLYQEYKDDDFIVLAVNVGESEKTVKEFIVENDYSFPVLLDITQATGIAYNTFSIPTSVLVDKEGIIRAYRPGLMSYEQMVELLDNLK